MEPAVRVWCGGKVLVSEHVDGWGTVHPALPYPTHTVWYVTYPQSIRSSIRVMVTSRVRTYPRGQGFREDQALQAQGTRGKAGPTLNCFPPDYCWIESRGWGMTIETVEVLALAYMKLFYIYTIILVKITLLRIFTLR